MGATRLLNAKRWKNNKIPTVEDWIMKILEFEGTVKLISFGREKSMKTFLKDWKLYIGILLKKGGEIQ